MGLKVKFFDKKNNLVKDKTFKNHRRMLNQITSKREDLNTSFSNGSSWPKEVKLISLVELIYNKGISVSHLLGDKILILKNHTVVGQGLGY